MPVKKVINVIIWVRKSLRSYLVENEVRKGQVERGALQMALSNGNRAFWSWNFPFIWLFLEPLVTLMGNWSFLNQIQENTNFGELPLFNWKPYDCNYVLTFLSAATSQNFWHLSALHDLPMSRSKQQLSWIIAVFVPIWYFLFGLMAVCCFLYKVSHLCLDNLSQRLYIITDPITTQFPGEVAILRSCN